MSKREETRGFRAGAAFRVALQFAFSRLYRYGGRGYDRLVSALFGDAWDEWRGRTIAVLGDGPVLDIGSGTGRLLEMLRAGGLAAAGVEREPSMLAAARRAGRGPLVRADARQLPFATGSIGGCVSTFPAPFILEDAVLNEVARVLRPAGRFAVLLGGNSRRSPILPLRLVVRLVYGRQSMLDLPDASLLAHPMLPGRWQRIESPSGSAVLWVATRTDEG